MTFKHPNLGRWIIQLPDIHKNTARTTVQTASALQRTAAV
ncbi:conserved hypothetical protein [Neisseria gonorrhoeae DGI2]|uniref:Uncharacterized protein n=1 Tax=Neisseria gonorrhoeae (strain NCCP11945) TaxID=521006 RepID=B4RNY2_NEIG2|nr:Hypothetical protein NGK_0060 [Neisseria gonorrhoeae NCCP11945]EFE03535.1 conserved hypothetical protein [Neisseria gonorrhoeae DGI2]